jgi:putative PIN family toxin of toxin-antitoxin system
VKPVVVIDANIILSAAISKKGLPNQLLDLFFSERAFELIVSPAIIAEWYECISRKSIQKAAKASEIQLQSFIASIIASSTIVEDSTTAQGLCRDPKDDMYISAALDAGASCIVTGDNDLLDLAAVEHVSVITPRQFYNFLSLSNITANF